MLRVLDLFSGIGGFSLGLERAGMRTTAFCEIDPYCRKVLARHWPGVPIHDDIRHLDGTMYAGAVDLVCGGYPCQPFSAAGKQQGEVDPRHLWPEMHRIIREVRPRWVVAENVRGHISLGFDTVAAQLEDDGFTVWPFIVPACAVGAPHRRDRLWILANSVRSVRESGDEPAGRKTRPDARGGGEGSALANRQRSGLEGYAGHGDDRDEPGWINAEPHRSVGPSSVCGAVAHTDGEAEIGTSIAWEECNPWNSEPDVGRVAHGVPARVDRLKSLGNAVVPQIPELIGRAILAYEQQLGMAV